MPRQNCMRVFAMFDVFSDVVLRVHRWVGGERKKTSQQRDATIAKVTELGRELLSLKIKVGSTECEKNE